MRAKIQPTEIESVMRENDFIVSKTDKTGVLIYCNRIFMEFAKYEEHELLGQQHNIIRHPDMARCIFKLSWDTIQNKKEINAYVKNLAENGSFCWVEANITPVFDSQGIVKGYYSVIRKTYASKLEEIKGLNKSLLNEESKYTTKERSDVVQKSVNAINKIVQIVSQASTNVLDLGKDDDKIGEIIKVINEIDDQTNLQELISKFKICNSGTTQYNVQKAKKSYTNFETVS